MRREQIDSTIVDGLIVGDLANTLTVEDRVLLSEWVEQSDKNREYYLQLKQVLSVAAADEPSGVFDAEMAYHRFEQRLAQGSNVAKVRMPYFVTARRVMMFAASLLVVVAVSLFSFHFGERGVLEQLADVVVEAPIGSKAKVVLPDGSRVTLNAGSTISYAQDFGITERSCKLVGEAMFEVEKSPEKSFVVSTSGVDVKVLGTVFNVCNYDSDRRAIVTLLEGSVELETARSRRIM